MKKYQIDKNIQNKDDEEIIGNIYNSRSSGKFRVLGIHSRHKTKNRSQKVYVCEFLETGYQTLAEKHTFMSGYIKDIYSPSVYGIGYYGMERAKYRKHYKRWMCMMERCYSGKHESYKNTVVSKDWLNFKNFHGDFECMRIIGLKECFEHNIKNYQIDKDIFNKNSDSSEYSLEKCCIVPKRLNLFFIRGIKTLYNRVKYNSKRNNYKSSYCSGGSKFGLGTFDSYDEALDVAYSKRINLLDNILKEYDWINNEIKQECYRNLQRAYTYALENKHRPSIYKK